jgi:hypothetical protein
MSQRDAAFSSATILPLRSKPVDNKWLKLLILPIVGILMTGIMFSLASPVLGKQYQAISNDPDSWKTKVLLLLKVAELTVPWLIGFDGMYLQAVIASMRIFRLTNTIC